MNVFGKITAAVALRIAKFAVNNNKDKTITVLINTKNGYKQVQLNFQEVIEGIINETITRGITFPNPDKHIIQNREVNDSITTFPEQPNMLFDKEFEVDDDPGNTATKILKTRYVSDVPDAVTTTADVGNISTGTAASALKGQSFSELFDEAFFSVIIPPYTLPNFSVTNSTSRDEERGITLNETIQSTFFKNDYGGGSAYRLLKDFVTVD